MYRCATIEHGRYCRLATKEIYTLSRRDVKKIGSSFTLPSVWLRCVTVLLSTWPPPGMKAGRRWQVGAFHHGEALVRAILARS